MNPTISAGVFNQKDWPGHGGDFDDCWVLAALMAVHGVAPWSRMHTIPDFRAAAGNPDDPTKPDGGTIAQVAQAIAKLYPDLAEGMVTLKGGSWSQITAGLSGHSTVYLHVLSSALPAAHRYGFAGRHAVAAAITDKLRLGNPLARPHSRWKPITLAQLKAAADAYPEAGIWGLALPSAEEAFTTHPLFRSAAEAGRRTEHARQAAGAKVTLLPLEL